jgi:hypothetical protein
LSVVGLLFASVYGLYRIGSLIDFKQTNADNVYTILSGIEASLNVVVLMGAALLFLATAERRFKRAKALKFLHELRSLAHVIDMHQMPKDPNSSRISTVAVSAEPGAPQRPISLYELSRYLGYCSELLSMVAKVSALYAQHVPDEVVVNAVSDIERLSTDLSSKIWQKITITEAKRAEEGETVRGASDNRKSAYE